MSESDEEDETQPSSDAPVTSESEEEEEEEEAPKGVPLQANGPAAPQQKASDALLLLLLHTNASISKQVARAPMTHCTLLNGNLHLLVLSSEQLHSVRDWQSVNVQDLWNGRVE